MDLEKRIEKYKKNPFFRANENLRYFVEKHREWEIPLLFMGLSTNMLINKTPEFDSKILQEEHYLSLSTWLFSLPFLLFSSGFFGSESYLKNFSKNKAIPLIGFSVGFSTNYYSNIHSNNIGGVTGFLESLFIGGISYYFFETTRTFMSSSNQKLLSTLKSLIKNDSSVYIPATEFQNKTERYESKEDLLSLISKISNFDILDGGLIEPVIKLSTRICSTDKTGNVSSAYKIKLFHLEKSYSKILSEIDKLEGFEQEELALVKAYYVSQLYNQEKVNIPEFLKLGENPKETFWKKVWNLRSGKFDFQNLGGKRVYEIPEEFSKFLQQQIVFKKGKIKKEVELLNEARTIFSRYKGLDVVNVDYFCDEGMIMSRERGQEGWDIEDSKVLKNVGKGIALLQNNLNEKGLVLDLDSHPGNFYSGKSVTFADLRGQDCREDIIDIVKATQVRGRSEYLIESWLKQRGHERRYGKEVLMEMIKFPEVCKKKQLRGKQDSYEITRRRYEKARWAENQLGLERLV